jgi:hypothetical protein
MVNPGIKILLYLGDTLIGDVNKYAENRHLSEGLKSEQENASSDQFSFDVNWKKFKQFVALKFDEDPSTFLRVGKTRVVFIVDATKENVVIGDGRVRFSGWLSSRPSRSGEGSEQTLSLTFFENFARLSGDLVCDPTNVMSPMRVFTNRPGHLYTQDLINEFMDRAAAAGETLNWDYGIVDTLANKTITYKDFQTVSKAVCDAMNNVEGNGKYDVVFRTDPADYTHQFIDILKPRGRNKNIIIKYPSDGVYVLWSSNYQIEETNDYASGVLVSGNGQVGDPDAGEDTAELAEASSGDFVAEYCYWRTYESQSNLQSADAVLGYANKLLAQRDFGLEVPQITLVGRPIAWGDADNDDNGLAIGDGFYFQEANDDGSDQSGSVRIIGLETDYDNNGVATVQPSLLRVVLV